MSATYNVEWLLKKLKWVVNYNEGQPNQNYRGPSTQTDKHFLDALNEAYQSIIRKARETRAQAWRHIHDVTWPSADVTFELPDELKNKQVTLVRDITDGIDGPIVDIGDFQDRFEVFRRDFKTLQWGTTGPGRDTTLRFFYLVAAEPLIHNAQVPELVPEEFKMLLVYEAAFELRIVSENRAPEAWYKKIEEMSESFHKLVSRGWPMESNIPRIRMTDDAL